MTTEEMNHLLHVLGLDFQAQPSLTYIFYTDEQGRVNNFSISRRKCKKMTENELVDLMTSQYPSTRHACLMHTERGEGQFTHWLEAAEVCRMLNISASTLRRWTQKGYLEANHIGSRIYYDHEAIDCALRSNAFGNGHNVDGEALQRAMEQFREEKYPRRRRRRKLVATEGEK